MKNIISIILCLVMLCSVIGCAATEEPCDMTAFRDAVASRAEADNRYKWILAFVDRHPDECAELAGGTMHERDKIIPQYEEWYEPLKSLEFGNCSTYDEESKVIFKFEITDSDFEVFPEGSYTYEVTDGVISPVSWHRISPESEVTEEDDLVRRITYSAMAGRLYDFEYGDTVTEEENFAIFQVIDACNRKVYNRTSFSGSDMRTAACEMFGADEYEPIGSRVCKDGDTYSISAGGGWAVYTTLIASENTDDLCVREYQMYADPMYMAKSYRVRYTLSKADSEFGYRFEKAEILDEGVGRPLIWIA